jgi:hypothetical protein
VYAIAQVGGYVRSPREPVKLDKAGANLEPHRDRATHLVICWLFSFFPTRIQRLQSLLRIGILALIDAAAGAYLGDQPQRQYQPCASKALLVSMVLVVAQG